MGELVQKLPFTKSVISKKYWYDLRAVLQQVLETKKTCTRFLHILPRKSRTLATSGIRESSIEIHAEETYDL